MNRTTPTRYGLPSAASGAGGGCPAGPEVNGGGAPAGTEGNGGGGAPAGTGCGGGAGDGGGGTFRSLAPLLFSLVGIWFRRRSTGERSHDWSRGGADWAWMEKQG